MAKEKKYTWAGYDETGNIRNEFPPNFFRGIKWDRPPECKDIKKAPLSYKRPREVAEILNAYFPKDCFHVYGELVNTWLSDSSGNDIPTMREKDERGNTKATWVHNYIIEQIIDAIEKDKRIILKRPGQIGSTESAKDQRIRELEDKIQMMERRFAIFEHHARASFCMIFNWFNDNFPNEEMKEQMIFVSETDSKFLDDLGIKYMEEGAANNVDSTAAAGGGPGAI